GSHIERWDTAPPRGQRIAHGRGNDGFWYNSQYHESHTAGWFHMGPDNGPLATRLWLRPGQTISPELRAVLERLFGPTVTAPPIAQRSNGSTNNGTHPG